MGYFRLPVLVAFAHTIPGAFVTSTSANASALSRPTKSAWKIILHLMSKFVPDLWVKARDRERDTERG